MAVKGQEQGASHQALPTPEGGSGNSSQTKSAASNSSRPSTPISKRVSSTTGGKRSNTGSAGRRKASTSPSKPKATPTPGPQETITVIPPTLRPYQIPVLISDAVDDVTISAPQIGKTFTAGSWLFGKCLEHGKDPYGRVCWWTAPTYPQVVHGFRNLVAFARNSGTLEKVSVTPPMELTLVNGGVIQARSWERPEGMYGPTVLFGVSDEFGLLTDQAYSAISSRRAETIAQGFGHWRWIGNVGDMGGAAESLWRQAEAGEPGFACRRWTWRDRAAAHRCACGNGAEIPIELGRREDHAESCPRGRYLRFIHREQSRMSGPQFRQLYDAEWVDWNLLPVYEFDRAVHVKPLTVSPHLPLELSCDFNVDPMCWVVGQHKDDEAWALDEIVIPGGATTREACAEFLRRYAGHRGGLVVYGDATGKARKTSASQSDYQIIRGELAPKFHSFEMRVPAANPAVTDRVNAYNGMLRAATGQIRYWIAPACKTLTNDLARVSWKAGTRDIEKKNRTLTHASDADGYRIHYLFPVRSATAPVVVDYGKLPVDSMSEMRW